jgi:hypothetical protein
MAIISSYFEGESYGLLGPQVAATVIRDHTPYECIVIALSREDSKDSLKKVLSGYFGTERPIVAFSTLSGRVDLFTLAAELKKEGAITFLAGPQAGADYLGEEGWKEHPHRFRGLSENFLFALQGPAEQALTLLKGIENNTWKDAPGLFYPDIHGRIKRNPSKVWDETYLGRVCWSTIYRIDQDGLKPLKITLGQVLQQIGCPYAARERILNIDYPAAFEGRTGAAVKVTLKGCSFCDVAADKGFYGELKLETVLSQIACLPEIEKGAKIPFELINENALPHLPPLLRAVREREIRLSQINLILRADWFLKGEGMLRESLDLAGKMGFRILLASVGFEAFDDRLLMNFNKGSDVKTNLNAVRLMRRLKQDFPLQWAYSREEGALHGFIHPTPWDTDGISATTRQNIAIYNLNADILPPHSTPLIIHHASCLGHWIREIEALDGIRFKRYGSVIGWWERLE